MTPLFERRLDRLAEIIVTVGIGLLPGQELIIAAPIDAAALVRRLTVHAYRAGSPIVSVMLQDPANEVARYEHAHDGSFDRVAQWQFDGRARALREGTASLFITGEDPALLAGQDPARIGRMNRARAAASQDVQRETNAMHINWCIAAAATPAWAAAVFPDLPPDQALARLWDAIFAVSRVDEADPVAAWHGHVANLQARAVGLNEKRYAALHFRGPNTDLTVGLTDRHLWRGGAVTAANGAHCVPNMPTEEVFTMPHHARVNGVVRSTKPLSFGGTLIDDIVMRFEDGAAVNMSARVGEDVLRRVMQTDAGARRLGEVALVPDASPVAMSNVLFQNTLFDENAASHIAIGRCLRINAEDGLAMPEAELAARGGNDSLIHIDWMIGSGKMDVDGILPGGATEPVMRQGAWA